MQPKDNEKTPNKGERSKLGKEESMKGSNISVTMIKNVRDELMSQESRGNKVRSPVKNDRGEDTGNKGEDKEAQE